MELRAAVQDAFFLPLEPVLLDALRRGERGAHAAVFERYQHAAYNLAVRVVGDAMAAEDVVQDVFLRLPQAVARFRGDAPFGAWLRRLVANGCIDELRRRQWLDRETPPEALAEVAGARGLAEAQAEAWALLRGLSPRARAVLVLHAVEGYTHAELAALFGQSESWSKSILARTLRRLQQQADGGAANAGEEDERRHAGSAGP
jgi:RNA polymerase sigma-70 factor (ECF subfamily)